MEYLLVDATLKCETLVIQGFSGVLVPIAHCTLQSSHDYSIERGVLLEFRWHLACENPYCNNVNDCSGQLAIETRNLEIEPVRC